MDITSNNNLAYGSGLIPQLNNQGDVASVKTSGNASNDINFANLMNAIVQGNSEQMGAIQAIADLGVGSGESFQSGDNLSNMFRGGNMSATTMQGLLDMQSQNLSDDTGSDFGDLPSSFASVVSDTDNEVEYTSTATKSRSETVDSILSKLEEMEASKASKEGKASDIDARQELFMAIDSDGDGKLSQQELSDFGPAIRDSFGSKD